MRHASFFSGVGGLDLGFERAGIETVSVSEIDRYANAVLAERFPDAPNLGNITEVNANDIPEADVWSGGFPCQDLSTAGKRAGFAGKRSSLAFTFLDLVEQRRPRWLVLENVPGLFSSNNGADFGRLLYEMDQLGYGVAWRTLDARYFGVAQRRRRVFIVGSLESDRAAEVLFECEGCERHPASRGEARQDLARNADGCIAQDRQRAGANSSSASIDTDRMRTTYGLPRRVDNSIISFPSRYSRQPTRFNDQTDPLTLAAGAPAVLQIGGFYDGWNQKMDTDGVHRTLRNGRDSSDFVIAHGVVQDDPLVPKGLDGHRYRCCGNGVVATVAQWIGEGLTETNRRWKKEEEENG